MIALAILACFVHIASGFGVPSMHQEIFQDQSEETVPKVSANKTLSGKHFAEEITERVLNRRDAFTHPPRPI